LIRRLLRGEVGSRCSLSLLCCNLLLLKLGLGLESCLLLLILLLSGSSILRGCLSHCRSHSTVPPATAASEAEASTA
jgi:hypothetical protein